MVPPRGDNVNHYFVYQEGLENYFWTSAQFIPVPFDYCTLLRTGTISYTFFIVFRALGKNAWYILNKMPIKLNLNVLSCLLKLGM